MERTYSIRRTEDSAKKSRTKRTFSPAAVRGVELMAELNRAEISARIKEARDQAGLTQPELGDLLTPPMRFRTIQTWESPKGPIPWGQLDEIARITGVTKEWLLHGDSFDSAGSTQLASEVRDLRLAMERLADLLQRQLDSDDSS